MYTYWARTQKLPHRIDSGERMPALQTDHQLFYDGSLVDPKPRIAFGLSVPNHEVSDYPDAQRMVRIAQPTQDMTRLPKPD